MRRAFGKHELNAAFRAIANHLKQSVTCYLIGGCAMTFRGQKVATKDIDLVVMQSGGLDLLVKAMEAAGFARVPKPGKEYRELGARIMMEDPNGMRFDLFEEVVCRKLAFSPAMQRRSTAHVTLGKLTVRLASAEDIFLFKGVTDRLSDLNDMSVLAEGGLVWDTVREECLAQESGRNWASRLVHQLEKLDDDFDVVAPITAELREWAEAQSMSTVVSEFLGDREKGFDAVRNHLRDKRRFTDHEVEEELSRLVKFGFLRMNKRRGIRYYRRKP